MQTLETRLDGRGVRVGVVVSRFNHLITLRLLEG
jgi:6,7-dimethyl-8-ribityllumazine synthase